MSLRTLEVSNITLITTRRWIDSDFNNSEFIGFDTETYKGFCNLLCDSKGNYIYKPSFKECLDFLFKFNQDSYYYAFWNLDFDISAMLKLWNDLEQIDKLIHGEIIVYKGYTLYYIRPKMFRINKGRYNVYLVDLFNMFHRGLNKASKEFLNESKLDIIDPEKLNTDIRYWIENIDDIIDYCLKDALLVAKLGNFLMDNIKDADLVMPKYFTSHASLSKTYFRNRCKIASLKYIPTNILDIAMQTYYGGRFEVLKRGYFKKLFSYDLNSAYPAVIVDLPSLKYGRWDKVNKLSKNECIGFYKVVLDIKDDYISPFPLKVKNLVVYPRGYFATWITWYEADLLRDNINVVYGYEYIPNEKREYYPFRKAMLSLYEHKRKNKDINDVLYWLFKLTMNSLYGCFVERHKKYDGNIYCGVLFNSVYASILTAKCRWLLLKSVPKKYKKNIVAYHTDSITSTCKLPLDISDELGKWSLESSENGDVGVIIASGVYQIGEKTRRRGFSKKKINWFDELEKFGDLDYIPIEKKRMVKIAESLRRWHNIDKVNVMVDSLKKLRINSDKKRIWKENFSCCSELLEKNISSKNLILSYIREDNLK